MDQHVVTDWKAYFESLGPGRPYDPPPAVPYAGEPKCSITYVCSPLSDLEVVRVEDPMELFTRAQEVYEANGGPEMWIFSHVGGPPWHVSARPPPPKNQQKRRK